MESVSKVWSATLILLLAQEGERTDRRQRRLPVRGGPCRRPGECAGPELRARITATAERLAVDPSLEVPPTLLIELAAWQPLLFAPGTQQRHSNIEFNIAGMIAERATGDDLATLFRERIFRPLGLRNPLMTLRARSRDRTPAATEVTTAGRPT
jgi:D-alanyl-D-alanine carboxypeptidase